MNPVLWVMQTLLALHTVMGAFWKFSNTAEQAVPSLKAIPPSLWTGMSIVELFCAAALILPVAYKPSAIAVPIAALCIAAEMLIFIGVGLSGGMVSHGEIIYWGIVAAFCAFIAYGRLALQPI